MEICDGNKEAWIALQEQAGEQGHQLQTGVLYDKHEQERSSAVLGLQMVICRTCGAFASAGGKPQRLLEPCRPPTAAGKDALDRVLLRGLHPKSGRNPAFFAAHVSPPVFS